MWGTQEKAAVSGGALEYPECTITSGQMTTLQTLNNANFNTATSMAITNGVLFLGTQSNNKLVSVNINNPSDMKFISFLATGYATAYVGAKNGKVATSAGSGDRVVWSNTNNPALMTVLNSLDVTTADSPGNFAFLDGAYDSPYMVFPSLDDDRVMIFDDLDKNGTMALTGSVTNATTLDGVARVAASGNYIYASVRTADRLTIIDASNKAAPVIVGSITDTRLDDPAAIDVKGNYVYVPSRVQNRLNVVDVSNPAAPTIVGSLLDAQLGNPEWVVVRGKYAFVGSWLYDRVLAIDISNPASPAIVDSWQMPGGGAVSGLPAFKGSTMFIGSYDTTNNIHSVDLGCDPQPELEGLGSLFDATCPAGYTYNKTFNSCYRHETSSATWSGAEANCVTLGGHLTHINSARESAFIASHHTVQQWIGINDITAEGTYVWPDGRPNGFTLWSSGEPNAGTNEDCGEITVDGLWNDNVCTLTRRYTCEAEPTFPDITCDPGYSFIPNAMKCVKITTTSPGTWPASKTACEADGAALPIILSDKKNDAYMDLGLGRFWIGMTDVASEQYWQWTNGQDGGQSDGDRDSYVNWFPGEPDGDSDYVGVYNSASRQWDDAAIADARLCEKDPEEICNPEHYNVKEVSATGGTTLTLTGYAVPNVKDRILFVTASEENAAATTITPTSATFNGLPMTRVAASSSTLAGNDSSAVFYLLDPPAVTGNIVVTFSGTVGTSMLFASVVNCLAQQAPEAFTTNTFQNASEAQRTLSTNITTLSDNAFIVDSITASAWGDFRTVEPGHVEVNSWGDSGGVGVQGGMGSMLAGSAGPQRLTWYHPSTARTTHVVAAFETTMAGAGGDNLGNHAATANLDMNTFKVTNVATPTAATDGATKAYEDSVTGAAETDPQVGALTNGKFCRGSGTTQVVCDQNEPSSTPSAAKYAVFVDQKPYAVNGGLPVINAWTDRTLNTVRYDAIGATLASDQVSLPAGTYYFDAAIPFKNAGSISTRLVTSGGTVLLTGINTAFGDGTTANANMVVWSYVRGVVTLGATTSVKLQYVAQNATGNFGLGQASTPVGPNQYTTLTIQKLD